MVLLNRDSILNFQITFHTVCPADRDCGKKHPRKYLTFKYFRGYFINNEVLKYVCCGFFVLRVCMAYSNRNKLNVKLLFNNCRFLYLVYKNPCKNSLFPIRDFPLA